MKRSLYTIKLFLPILMFLLASFCIQVYGQSITGFSPLSISAGTGSQLTITGTGFGAGPASSTKYVEFADADDGGASYMKPAISEYISWADNQIVLKVPSGAGTGQIRVVDGGTTLIAALTLKVTYNILNSGVYPRLHVNANTKGGYTFQFENGFNGNAAAKNAFRKSLQAWTCQSNINWSIGTITNVNTAGKDGTNVVRFDSGSELPAGVLGVAYTYSSTCGGNNWQITETDIVFDKETTWHYTDKAPGFSESDFQSVALHELGHAHNLGHVIDNSDMMSYAIAAGSTTRVFSTDNKAAATYQVDLSKVTPGGACLAALIPVQPATCNFLFPVIDSISPPSAGRNGKINIIGENLSAASFVSLGGTSAESFSVKSDKLIEVLIGTGFTGEVSVTTPGGIVAYNGFTFLEPPDMTSFNPKFGFTGDTILIEGLNFQGLTALSFGGTPAASFLAVDNQHVKAVLASGSTGKIILSTTVGTDSIPGFTFSGDLSILSVTPLQGIFGDTITIRGSNFREISSVKFGGVNAASYQVVSTETIKVVLGAGGTGSVDLISAFGATSFTGFTFVSAPLIGSFSPDKSVAEATVAINGENFLNASEVSFGGTPAKSFIVNSAKLITAKLGEGTSGAVTVKTPGGKASKDGFIFIETLRISSFSPKIAATGQKVVVTGSKFRNVIDVSFGNVSAKSFTVDSPGQITAVVGNGTSGQLTVRTSDGIISSDGFKFLLPSSISYFTPQSAGAGTKVIINGTNFDEITSVQFGNTEAASFKVLSPTAIEAILAAGASGIVKVVNPGGNAEIGGFTFIPPPVINSVDPLLGTNGTELTIKGNNFSTVHRVTIGNKEAASFRLISPEQITAIVADGAGDGAVKVLTGGGSVSMNGFRYILPPLITAFSPQNAIAGVSVLITGSNLLDVNAVSFGGKAAASFKIISSTIIEAVVAPGSSSGSLKLTSPGGTVILEGFVFTYTLPANNFSISATDLTCKASSNGMINIKAQQTMNYMATISGNGKSTIYQFSNSLEVKNLPSGEYSICMTIVEQPTFQQCFELLIREPKDLSLYSYINKGDNKLNLTLDGSDTYFIELNGQLTKSSINELQLSLKSGINTLKVYTAKRCQGIIEKTFMLDDAIKLYPNPFDTELNILLGTGYSGIIKVEIRNIAGALLYTKEYPADHGNLKMNLDELASGAYLIRISNKEYQSVRKILKR